MSISADLAKNLQRIRRERDLSLKAFSNELGIPLSSTEKYCSGTGNPRADTLDMLSEVLGIPVTEIVSDQLPGQEQAETIVRAAKALSGLIPESQERGIQLFLELVALFSEGNHI